MKSDKDESKKPMRERIGEDLPPKYFNPEGDLDLRQVTGDEAAAYLRKIGW